MKAFEDVIEMKKDGVKCFFGNGFFQIVFKDGTNFQVCCDENEKINLSDLGEDWGVCGDINKNFSGDILAETKKYAKIFNIEILEGTNDQRT